MNSIKTLLVATTLVTPMLAFAGGGQAIVTQQLAAGDSATVKETSDHTINKKAVALEAKEQALGAHVRDWTKIDSNKDHTISPDEMQTFLNGVWGKKENS